MLSAPGPHFTAKGKNRPEPGLNFSFTVLTLSPHPSRWQIRGKLACIDPLSSNLIDSWCPSWISNLPAHLPGPSTSLTLRLAAPRQQGGKKLKLKIGTQAVGTIIETSLHHHCTLPAHTATAMETQDKGLFCPLRFALQCQSEDSLPEHSTLSSMKSPWRCGTVWP